MTAARLSPRNAAVLLVAGLLVIAIAAGWAIGLPPSGAGAQEPPPIGTQPLTGRHRFTDEVGAQIRLKPAGRARQAINLRDASNIAVLKITVQPGARFPWHTHPGPVMAAVTEGRLVYAYADDCVRRPYPSGTAFVDPGGSNVHTAFNPSSSEVAVVIATFLNAPADGPLTLPVDANRSQALDRKCGMAPATAHAH